MLDQDKILNFIKTIGPTLPYKVAKYIGVEIFIASAHLSMLASQGKIKISKLKVGGSPLYYLPGQEDQLQQFTAENLDPKDLSVLKQLKEQQILREADLELLARVSLRSLKDFATPLHVVVKDRRELFWSWYLLSHEETQKIIGERLKGLLPGEEKNKDISDSLPATAATPSPQLPSPFIEQNSGEKPMDLKPTELAVTGSLPLTKLSIKQESTILDKQTKLGLIRKRNKVNGVEKLVIREETKSKTDPKEQPSDNNRYLKEKINVVKKKITLSQKKLPETTVKDSLLSLATELLEKLNISTRNMEVIRKNAELNLRVEVPSVVGKTNYFCKVRKKQRIDEKDLSAACMEAQLQKLPLLLLYTNQLTKKAEEILHTEAFSNVVVKKLE